MRVSAGTSVKTCRCFAPSARGVIASLLLLLAAGAQAAYPDRPIRLIVPQAPGAASDTIARIVATEVSRQIGQQVVVDNRPGGALMIGLELVSRATPDGYTIGFGPVGGLAISPHVVGKLSFDIQKLQPIAQTASNQLLIAAGPAAPFKTVRDIVEFSKQNPGKLSNASSGNGTPGHVGFELFKTMTATKIVHVPYKGGAAAITDLVGGQVHLMMESLNSIAPHAKGGRVRAIAVTGARRTDVLPDVPTVAESGVPGYEATTWNGIVGPAGLPRPVVLRLNLEINRALASAPVKERFAAIGAEGLQTTPEQFGELVKREYAKWGEVVRRSGARID